MIERFRLTFAAILIAAGLTVCPAAPLHAQAPVVEITATDYAFRAPHAIASGWTTIRFKNDGEEHHFVLMSRLPEGKTVDDYEIELSQPFSEIGQAVWTGEIDQEEVFARIGEVLPEWFQAVQFMGGPGLVTPAFSSETTMYLEPGNYALECYMKTEDGKIHYMEGMLRPLVVTEEASGGSPPETDVRITLSNFEMDVEGELAQGRHVIAVHVAENPEEGFGHNVQLARLNPDAEVEEVVSWMNWFSVKGMRPPAPAEFIGGVHVMPVGSTAYFTAELEPGRYLLISEYTAHQGVLHEFTVAP